MILLGGNATIIITYFAMLPSTLACNNPSGMVIQQLPCCVYALTLCVLDADWMHQYALLAERPRVQVKQQGTGNLTSEGSPDHHQV